MVRMVLDSDKTTLFPSRFPRLACRLATHMAKVVVTIAIHAVFLNSLAAGPVHQRHPRLYLNYSAKPEPRDLTVFDVCILEPESEADLGPGHKVGNTFLAYVSAVEVRPGTPAARSIQQRKIPLLGRNETWGTDLVDVTDPEWERLLLDTLAGSAIAKGYDGVFLDTLDSVELISRKSPEKATACRESLVRIVRKLRARYPDKQIVLNRGFSFLDQVAAEISGVLVESVFQTFDRATGQYKAVDPQGTRWLESQIRHVQMLGLPFYAVDYVDPNAPDLALRTARRLSDMGCIPFVTTPDLDGQPLAPVREVPRRILVLFGWDPQHADKPATWPVDTLAAEHLQAVLEWMGYEVEYLDVGKKPLPEPLPPGFAGVIADAFLAFRPEEEQAAAHWLTRLKDRGVPILFTGAIPFTEDEVKDELTAAFGFSGTMRPVHGAAKLSIARLDRSIMNAETRAVPRSIGFQDVRAPATARLLLSIRGEDRLGNECQFDPVFLAPWGGMWLEPYVALRASQEHASYYADPFRFLAEWLKGAKTFPAPDTTTRDGRRIYYSHLDGDGFASLTHFPGHPTCAEVIHRQIIQRYPLPVTVSVVEADIRGWLKTLKPDDATRYEHIARSIFAHPHVQAASHSFSHPFIWDAEDPNPGHYEAVNVALNDEAARRYPHIDPVREIKGSIDYINQRLLPPGRKVELMLWSGNCRPGTQALKICRELGVENMNGGDTIISELYPGLSGVAPRAMPWDDELQIFAANQNEFMYAGGFQGPFYGGFDSVIDTFQRTGSPRRLKPVNLYYHFYSATYLSSQRALEKVHDWCMKQPLHAVTALEYAQLVRDARNTKCFEIAPAHWLISCNGQARTLRVPASAGVPDLARCRGVIGFKTEGDTTYIHTSGKPAVELVLTDAASAAPPHLRLVEAGADITIHELTPTRTVFTVAGFSKVDVVFAGIPPSAWVDVRRNTETGRLQADAHGTLTLSLPPGSVATLSVTPSPYAASP